MTTEIANIPEAFFYHRVEKNRLTKEYIRKQALRLGKSLRHRLKNKSFIPKTISWLSEITKLLVSFPLGLGYLLSFKPAKAALLLKFRWWIWKEYLDAN